MGDITTGSLRNETEQISELIGDIYDAALEPRKWIEALNAAARFVRGRAASVFSKNVDQKGGAIYFQHGLDPNYVRLYFDKYVKLDPTTSIQLFAEVGDILSTETVMPYHEFRETRFFKEWAHPQGLVDAATAILQKAPAAVGMFVVFRHERDGLVDDEMRRRMRLLFPHVRRSVLIGRLLDVRQSEAAAFADTLDALSAAIFLVDAECRIVHENGAARTLASQGRILSAVGGRLFAPDATVNGNLQDAFMAASEGDDAIGVKGVSLPLITRDGDDYVATVLPLTSGARRQAGSTYSAVAALFVSRVRQYASSPPEVIARRYKLTPMELRVLLAIVEVGGVPDVAEALGVSTETVKTHLGRIYGKTGVNRQAELVKLVMKFTSPIAST
jgi:DNA-binding CsgD family transcriptional regulator